MRRWLALSLVLLLVSVFAGSARADWMDDFESYALGSGLHGQGGWHGWDGSPAADAYITDLYSHSPVQSVEIAAASDMVHEFSGYTSGEWTFIAWQYIPQGFSGSTYFILLNEYTDLGPYNWSSQVHFDSSTMSVVSDPELDSLPLIVGQWVELRVVIDLNQDLQTFYYNDQILYSKSWTEGMSGGGSLNIAAVDLFANNASPVYYDDLSLGGEQPVPVENTSWGRVKQSYR